MPARRGWRSGMWWAAAVATLRWRISKLELACRYPDLPTVTWPGRYWGVHAMLSAAPPPDRVTELSGAGATPDA